MRTKFTTTVNKKLLKRIKMRAIKEGRNVNDILEELIKEYLKPKIKEEK